MHIDTLFKLLPRGQAFSRDAPHLHNFVAAISREFDRVAIKAENLLQEIPGRLNDTMEGWRQILAIPDKAAGQGTSLQEAILGKLSAVGGQSHKYLESVIKRFNPQAHIRPVRGQYLIKVYGVGIKKDSMRCGHPIGSPLKCYRRNEALISALEEIKHAETKAMYFNLDDHA